MLKQIKKDSEFLEKQKKLNKQIEETLMNYYSKIKEANEIAITLHRRF